MEQDDSIFGCDYSSLGQVTATGDIETIEGLDNAKQNIKNWLLTDKGYYPNIDDEYGCEIRQAFGEDFEEESITAAIIYIKNALLDNPRVLSISEIKPYITINNELKMLVNIVLVNGTEDSLTVAIEEEV